MFDRGQAKKEVSKIRSGATKLEGELARLVAVREGINAVVTGSIERHGKGYKMYLETESASGIRILKIEKDVSNKQDVPAAVAKLAQSIRKALGDTTSD